MCYFLFLPRVLFPFTVTSIYLFFHRELKDIKGDKLPHLTSKKLMDAGFEFKHSLEEMLDDTIQCCKDKAYL